MTQSIDARQRLRMLAQADLGGAAQIITGEQMWSRQRAIAKAVSKRRSKVNVPSCNASGKTWLAARIALAFYEAYTPGTPCIQCGGPCRGSKIITTSSKEEHLRDNLWGEIRTARAAAAERGIEIPGRYLEGDLRIVENESNHFITGQSAATAEGMQGYHAAHKLIIGDEATSVSDDVKLAITRLLATADARLLLIFNPTTPDTYAAIQARSPRTTTIPITAWDTPMFTGEPVPPGANLIDPEFLEDLKAQGMGPGTFEWVTSIEARFWDLGDDLLVPHAWYDQCVKASPPLGGIRQLGIDLATYGSDECVIAVRDGQSVVELQGYPSMRMDTFFEGPVTEMVKKYLPHFVTYDADGVGAGVIGYADKLHKHMNPGGQVIGFRGGVGMAGRYHNARAAWYWNLRRRFEFGAIDLGITDEKLREQITDIHYQVTPQGNIRVETKAEMKKRGMRSPDRADALMYAFALSEDLRMPDDPKEEQPMVEHFDVPDHSEAAMWERMMASIMDPTPKRELNPVFGVPDDL